QLASVQLHFSKAFAVNPRQQADEVLPAVFIPDSGNILRRVRRHYSWKCQIDLGRAKKPNHLILKFEELERFFAVGNLQDELLLNWLRFFSAAAPFLTAGFLSFDQKVLVPFTRKRRSRTFNRIELRDNSFSNILT